MSKKAVEMKNITKTFGKVYANKDLTFQVRKGEIYALLGENGAGKSTLMNILSGVYQPDGGSILIHEKEVHFKKPADSIAAGIGMIYQHFKLVEVMTAMENIILGKSGAPFLNRKKMSAEINKICEYYNLQIDVDKKIYDMSVGEKQTVEILKVLYQNADILILDEPTAVLTPQETKKLFDILRRLKADGCSVIIITHKLNEVMDISDWVTVMRKGEVTGTVKTSETSPVDLTNMMVGETVDLQIERPVVQQGDTVLELDNLSVVDREKVHKLKNITFNLHKGEILGVAGVAGSGQKELCEAIAGLYPVESGDIRYKHESLVGKTSRQIIEIGISMSFVPEDRLGMGLAASMDMVHNVMLKSYYHQRSFLLNKHEPAEKSKELVEKLNIKTPGIYHPVKQLSGGNIQKILLGRELDSNPNVIITAYPTRGLDIGSSHLIYDLLNEQKVKDTAILYVGEDLDVLMELCDRIMILCDGELISIVDAKTIKKDELGLMMAGQRLEDLNV